MCCTCRLKHLCLCSSNTTSPRLAGLHACDHPHAHSALFLLQHALDRMIGRAPAPGVSMIIAGGPGSKAIWIMPNTQNIC